MTSQILPPLNLPPNAPGTPTPSNDNITISGDVTGTTLSSVVSKIAGNPVQQIALGSAQDGYVLSWVNADGQLEAKPPAGSPSSSLPMAGDVTGTTNSNQVALLQGKTLDTSNLTDGAVLTYSVSSGGISLQAVSDVPMAGDVAGNTNNNQVGALQGKNLDLSNTTDGNVLTWSSTDNSLELKVPSSGTAGSNIFTYREAASPSGNVFSSFASAYAAAAATGVPATIIIDNSFTNCSIPAGVVNYDMSLITLAGFNNQGSSSFLTINDGVTWTIDLQLVIKDNLTILLGFTTLTALCVPVNDITIFMENDSSIFVNNMGNFIDASVNNVHATVSVGDNCSIGGSGANGQVVFGGRIIFSMDGIGNINSDAAGGAGSLSININNLGGTYPSTWSQYTGSTPSYRYNLQSQNIQPYTSGSVPAGPNTNPWVQTGTMYFNTAGQSPYWWNGSTWVNGAFQSEYLYMTLNAPQTNPSSGDPLIFNNLLQSQNNNFGGFSSASGNNFFIAYNAAGPNLAFKLTGNLGSLFDGNIAYQWWDVTNNVGVGNVSGNVGGGVPGDVVAIIPANYGGGQSINIFFQLRLSFASGTTFIGENTAGGFILPWMTMESIGSPQ